MAQHELTLQDKITTSNKHLLYARFSNIYFKRNFKTKSTSKKSSNIDSSAMPRTGYGVAPAPQEPPGANDMCVLHGQRDQRPVAC